MPHAPLIKAHHLFTRYCFVFALDGIRQWSPAAWHNSHAGDTTLKKLARLPVPVAPMVGSFVILHHQQTDLETLRGHVEPLAASPAPSASVVGLGCFDARAFFGGSMGTRIVSSASTLAATLAFPTARDPLRDRVRDRPGATALAIDPGLERDGPCLRSGPWPIPIVPYFSVTAPMGLGGMPGWSFHATSHAPCLPEHPST